VEDYEHYTTPRVPAPGASGDPIGKQPDKHDSDINLFRYGKGIIDLDAEVSDGAFDLGVPEQELHGA
jgi:hypothetical protein